MRPGLSTPLGSNPSFTRLLKARNAACCGSNTSTAARTAAGARTSVAWPPMLLTAAQMFYDWAGGLLWVAMPFADEPDAGSIRAAVKSIGGHATLVRAPAQS